MESGRHTVGLNTATVQKYIREEKTKLEDSLRRKEYKDPFEGSKQSGCRDVNKVQASVVWALACLSAFPATPLRGLDRNCDGGVRRTGNYAEPSLSAAG